jgi:alkylation response protein AidB-like acyl-CoA dehydrogenase
MPGSMAPSLRAKPVTGGWEVSGRAAWASGVMHADWVLMGGLTDTAQPHMFLSPIEDIEVDDTWHMSGMSGTGSNDMVARGVFVPEHRAEHAFAFGSGSTEGAAIHPNPIYRMPFMPFVQCEIIGVYSGGLRGATTAFDETVKSRVRGHTRAAVREQPLTHLQLGGAHVQAEIAEELARGQIRLASACLGAGSFQMADRLQLRAHAGFVVDHCRRAINELMSQSGSAAFRCDLPLQRFFRDMNMLATHAFFEWDTSREQYGRGKLGLDPTHPLL